MEIIMKKVDLAIIGGGGAAFAAASKANDLGVSAVLINKGLPMGGTCVNVGCVPSKFLLEAGSDIWRALHPRFNSLSPRERHESFKEIMKEKAEVVQRNRLAKYTNVLNHYKKVEYIEERAKFEGPGLIRAGEVSIEAKFIVIATGSSGAALQIPGIEMLERSDVLTNIEAFELETLPKNMIVIGGGPTGLEVAQIFHRFGSEVIVVQRRNRLLPITEPEISDAITKNLEAEGIKIHLNSQPVKVRKDGRDIVLTVNTNGKEQEHRAEKLFVAIGVRGNTEDLNLEAIGLSTDGKGFIEVDENMRTKAKNIYAAGDVTGAPWLETVAAREGAIAVASAFDSKPISINYDAIPAAVFIEPQVAIAGITEEELMRRIGKCSCRTVPLSFVPKADITNQTNGVAKMVIHPDTKKIVGFHLVGPNAAEVIHEAALAIQHGLTIHDIINLVHVFPSYSEVIKITAQAFTRDIQNMSCCVE
jgi:mercuric reductase